MSDARSDTGVRDAIRRHAERYPAPDDLRREILRVAEAGLASTAARPPRALSLNPRSWWSPLAAFAAGAVIAAVAVTAYFDRRAAEERTLTAIVSDHARSIVSGPGVEVESSNTHAVKPWLSSKLGYSPTVIDLAGDGFKLVGGRRGYLGRAAVGVLVYRYGEHDIDVYALPAREFDALPKHLDAAVGYQMRSWQIADIRYVALTDAAGERLGEFVDAFVRQASEVESRHEPG